MAILNLNPEFYLD
jgi:hypothetical protein